MTQLYLSQAIAVWIVGRLLARTALIAALPHGADDIYRGTRPQSGGAPSRFLSIDQRGNTALVCIPAGKDGLLGRYAVQVWQAGDDSDGIAPLAAEIDAALADVREVTGGYQFVCEALSEIDTGDTSQGVQYVTAGGLYEVLAGPG